MSREQEKLQKSGENIGEIIKFFESSNDMFEKLKYTPKEVCIAAAYFCVQLSYCFSSDGSGIQKIIQLLKDMENSIEMGKKNE